MTRRSLRDHREISQRSLTLIDHPEHTQKEHAEKTHKENAQRTPREHAENMQRTLASLAEHTHISRRATAILLMQCNGSNSWMALSLRGEGGRQRGGVSKMQVLSVSSEADKLCPSLMRILG